MKDIWIGKHALVGVYSLGHDYDGGREKVYDTNEIEAFE